MKHIKNSIKGSIFLLEHAGVPVALTTDFAEPIKNGSLCVNTTNQDLYILKGNVWVMMGSGFNMDDWIPRGGTAINKPVYGDIEITDGVKFYSGQSGINFSDAKLVLEFSDNDLDTSDNVILSLDRNILLQKSSAIVNIDSSSYDNYINRVKTTTAPGVTFSNSVNNIINSTLNFPTNFTDVSNSTINGVYENNTDFINTVYSSFYITGGGNNPMNFVNNSHVHVNLDISQLQTFNFESMTHAHVRGRVIGTNSTFDTMSNVYLVGTFLNTNYNNNNFVSSYGHTADLTKTNSSYIYNFGQITGDNSSIISTSSTSSVINLAYSLYNVGSLIAVDLNRLQNTLFLGNNSNIKTDLIYDNVLINNYGYFLSDNTRNNILYNNKNKNYVNTKIHSKLENSVDNILFNNNGIYSTSSNYNLVINTDNIKLYGSNSLVFTPRETFSGFTGSINGGNNVIFSLKPNKNYTIHSNVFTFGDINSTSGIHIKNGNIIMGNVDIDSTLTTNNQIFGAKRLQNINHAGQLNNIFLNVDNFSVPDSNTVYLPFKFYGVYLGNYGAFNLQNITTNQSWNFPDKSGTVALLDDIGSNATTAGNGLSITNDNKTIKWGGNLTEYTTINGNNNIINFSGLGSWYATTNSGVIQFTTFYSNTQNTLEIQNGYAYLKSRNTTTNSYSTLQNQPNLGYWEYYNGSSATTRIDISDFGVQLRTNNSEYANLKTTYLSTDRNYEFPDKSGTIALEDDAYLANLNDVDINNVQNGDFLVYNSASTSWVNLDIPFLSGTNMVIDISYGDLYSLWTSSGLITGAYYRFDYQTIHKIPYTSTINYGSVEKLIALAIAPNKLDKIVWSPSHPEDIIYYRIDDRIANSTVEDITLIDGDTSGTVGSPYIVPPATVEQAYLPTVMRPGRIYYREDTIARCSAPYDFRAVKFRRYKLKYPYEVASTTKPYVDGTVLNTGDIVVVGGNIYMAKFLFTCSTSGGTLATDVTFFYNITNYLNASLLYQNYVCPTPDTYVLADNRDTPYSSLILEVDNTQYFDFTTFDNNIMNSSPTDNNMIRSYNCNIQNYIPAWLEQVTWEYYPNIVFSNFSNNISIGIFSENITIMNSCNVDIDNYCKNMFVSTYNSYLCQTKIGARCENVFIENVYVSGANSQTNYLYHTIGIGNKNIINAKIANVTIGDKNLALYMFATQETRVGSQNQFVGFFGFTSGAEITQSKLGDFNTNICYSHVTYNNYIGDKNNLIILPTASHDNVIGNNNNYISGIKTAVDSMEGVSVGGAFYENTIGNNNNNITLAGFQNVIESNVEGVYATEYVSFNNLVFKSGSGNLLIDAGTNSVLSIVGSTFDYNRQLLGGLKTLTLNIQPISYNFLNYNLYDFSGGNTLVALRFVAYTDPSTYTMIAQRLYLT